ncbi:MAG TPA: pentapeptide repeat-containing protein [Leptolyngbyaceae cyanobacterium]
MTNNKKIYFPENLNDNDINAIQRNWFIAGGLLIFFVLLCFLIFLTSIVLNTEWSELLDKKIDYIIKIWTTGGLIFGGILGAINVYFGAKRAFAMEQSAKAAYKTAEAALKNAKAAEDKQITERFSKAIEQLASEKNEVRLGAIYTLERIVEDSSKDYWTIMELITTFVRENTTFEKFEKIYELEEDVFIDEYLESNKRLENLKKLKLFQEVLIVISRLNYQKPSDCRKVNLSNINVILSELREANFQEVNFEGAILIQSSFKKANLTAANLKGTNLRGTNLIEADLKNTNLSGADLSGADLSGADLTGANLTSADLTNANLAGANLANANLTNANLTSADLIAANLTNTDFRSANLTKSYLMRANLTEANFIGNTTIKPYQFQDNAETLNKAKYDKKFRQELGLAREDKE